MTRIQGDGLSARDSRYIQGLRSVARFGWLVYFFVFILALQVGFTAYFVKAIFFDREVIIWQSLSQCISLLFIIILFREKLVAHRVIEKLLGRYSGSDRDDGNNHI